MKLSVVIPARDEEGVAGETVERIVAALERERIVHEVIVVDDWSRDGTAAAVARVSARHPQVRLVRSRRQPGFGHAVRSGLDAYTGDAVAIAMADGSDSPEDLIAYHRLLEDGYECVFGSRFMPGSSVEDYPPLKLVVNRIVNWGIRLLFRHGYNDTTNAFKAYRREIVDSAQPLLSRHFNLTVELPLKAVVRGCRFAVVPISWTNRRRGTSKLSLNEMGSRYLFIVLYVFLEHHLSRGDYRRAGIPHSARRGQRPQTEGARTRRDGAHAGPPRRRPSRRAGQ
ncbi:MAG: glycosyltransferase family 2 protein [Chloroflexota bacterium]